MWVQAVREYRDGVPAWICETCGTQYEDTPRPAAVCAVCADERQFVPPSGQRWTSLVELTTAGHRCEVRVLETDLLGVGVAPPVGIGHRGLVVRTTAGNLLWDVPAFLDAAAVAAVRDFGGLAAITASHPHFYGALAEWAHAFPDARVLIPKADRPWVRREPPSLETWTGTLEALPGVTLFECGGHFAGSAVAHWALGAQGRGALLVGDTLTVTPGLDRVAAMRSYVNYLPLPEPAVRHLLDVFAPLRYDRIYAGWWDRVIQDGATEVVQRSLGRYLWWLCDEATGHR